MTTLFRSTIIVRCANNDRLRQDRASAILRQRTITSERHITSGRQVMDEGMRTLTNGVKLVGEALLPGTSLLMDGKFGEGAAHAVVGIGARILLGPIGALV